jgi:hypothetical protein
MVFSVDDDLSLLEGLWDSDTDVSFLASSPPTPIGLPPSSHLEEKLLSLETTESETPTDVVGDVQNADFSELDEILAKEMSRLTMQERDHVLQEIHGIADAAIVETPEFVEQRLQQLDECLARIAPTKEAYSRALYQSPDYVQDRNFRLMFLRCELFHVEQAAERLVRHFDEKLKLFGDDLLARDIRLSDLEDSELETLQRGAVQLLPLRDRADRTVVCLTPLRKNPAKPIERVYSVSWDHSFFGV